MSTTLSTADAVLKEDYKGFGDLLNQKFFILSQVEKNTDDVQGRRAIHAVHVSRNSGVGARAEGGTLPTAGNQGYTDTLVPVRYNYGTIKLSGPVIAAMASDRGSFVRAVSSEMDGLEKDAHRDVNRQIWGTSDGVIATCGTTSSATTIVLAATTTPTQIRQLWADGGGKVDIGTVANPVAVAADRSVTAYDPVNLTIDISGAAVSTTASTHKVLKAGAGGASTNSGTFGDGQSELTGLQTIVSNAGVLHGVDPATYPIWEAYVSSNSGTNRAASETLVTTAIQETNIASGGNTQVLVGSAGVSRAVANLMTSIRRNVDRVDLKAGYSGIAWSTPLEGMTGVSSPAILWDRDCPENRLYGLDFESLVEYVMTDWHWEDTDGSILNRDPNNTDSFLAYFKKYAELACVARNKNFVIQDITQG